MDYAFKSKKGHVYKNKKTDLLQKRLAIILSNKTKDKYLQEYFDSVLVSSFSQETIIKTKVTLE